MAEIQSVKADTEIFYTTKDVAQMLKIGKNKATKLMGQKDFPSTKIGNKYLIRKDKFIEFFERWKNKEYQL